MKLRLVADERADMRHLLQVAVKKHAEGNSPPAASRLAVSAALALHAIEVGAAQAALDAAEILGAVAVRDRLTSRRTLPPPTTPGAA